MTLAGIAACAVATPTSLILMPIADALGHREGALIYGVAGNERNVDRKVYHSLGVTLGLMDRVELGYFDDFEGFGSLDVKFQFLQADKGRLAVAAGVMNWRRGEADRYVALRQELKGWRLHAGWVKSDRDRGFVGADFPMPWGWSGAVEYVGGPNALTSAMVNVPMPRVNNLLLSVWGTWPTVKSDGIQWGACLTYGFRF